MFDDITERVSQMRRPGEEDMAYYERRYQERVSPSRVDCYERGNLEYLHVRCVVNLSLTTEICFAGSQILISC